MVLELISSRQNANVKEIAALCADAGLRRQRGLCVAHGYKMIEQIVQCGAALVSLWIEQGYGTENEAMLAPLKQAAKAVCTMTMPVCEKLSPQASPQRILAVTAIPPETGCEQLAARGRVVALCGVQDPANVGAVLRTAAAFGFSGALVTDDCADPFSPKALRASMGAAFEIQICRTSNLAAAIGLLRGNGHAVAALMPHDEATMLDDVAVTGKITLLVGSEGGGLPPEAAAACDRKITIPMSGRIESLNAAVAAGIAMWRLKA